MVPDLVAMYLVQTMLPVIERGAIVRAGIYLNTPEYNAALADAANANNHPIGVIDAATRQLLFVIGQQGPGMFQP